MTEAALREFLESKDWTFAKTMPQNPHFWLHISTCNPSQFTEAVAAIQREGIPEKYYRKVYKCVFFGEWKYWTMGYPPEQTQIINRCKIER